MTLTEFLLARIAEDEAWARAAIETPGATHWHWVDANTDEAVTVDPMLDEFIDYPENSEGTRVDLRTVEELRPVSWGNGAPLPDFALQGAQEVRPGIAGHIARHDPARVLAECEAKRRIVELHPPVIDNRQEVCVEEQAEWPCPTLRALATVYAGHSGYREEWRL